MHCVARYPSLSQNAKKDLNLLYSSLDQFLETASSAFNKGPIAIVFAEDLVEVESTLQHNQMLGFKCVILFAPDALELPGALEDEIHRIPYDVSAENALPHAVNQVAAAADGLWIFYCYNAEYLFFPFCETRSIGEMIAFNVEERRDTVLTYVVDLYAGDLWKQHDAVSLEDAHLDKSGYYALARSDGAGSVRERQLDFFGGLRWRFEEHIPKIRRKIDRVSLFKATKGVNLLPNHTFDDQEYNTYACPWHHNITAALCSFRTAKALKTNPGSQFDIETFRWHNSTEFTWNSQQLLDLGLMEPGQWF